MDRDALIELACGELDQSDTPNLTDIARKHGIAPTTLRRRWKGQSGSRAEAAAIYLQRLSTIEEDALIALINSLTNRGIPPTTKLVKNMAEEMIKGSVEKNWVSGFTRRHQNKLTSLYLQNMNSQRVKAEYLPAFKHFYDLVSVI